MIITLIGSILLCESIGIVSSLFTISAIKTWYIKLKKPSFNPPNGIFGPVWTILYGLMGVSLFLILTSPVKTLEAVLIFGIQLILNSLWSLLFFYFKKILLAFIEIILLFIAIVVTIILFWPINQLASYLLLPYLFWVGFASLLNFSIMKLN